MLLQQPLQHCLAEIMGEIYQGVKFRVIFRQKEVQRHSILDELKIWCMVFDEKGLAPPYPGGSFGNMSMRIPGKKNHFFITATATGLKPDMCDELFVLVEEFCPLSNMIWIRGTREPSSESFMHAMIYRSRPDVMAVFHGHSPEIIRNTTALGIPETIREEPYGTPALMNSVSQIMQNHNFFVMKNHGFVSLGHSACEAGNRAMEYHEKALKISV
jgi:ribulose-5-phosphate 4-epimerase/fuculose-1-phosphate aldolase